MTGDDTTATVRLTYAELAEARGVSLGAARRMVHRHRWPKQVGNNGLSRIAVPVEYATRVDNDVNNDIDRDVDNDVTIDVDSDPAPLQVIGLDEAVAAFIRVSKDVIIDSNRDVREDVVMTLQEAIASLRIEVDAERERADRTEALLAPMRDQLGTANRQIAMLTTRLEMANERADRAAVCAQVAEARATEYQQQLQAEMVEHRRAMSALAERIPPVRRSWWPWRNRR
jgi:flagellar biosynthesis chaperone FliJ